MFFVKVNQYLGIGVRLELMSIADEFLPQLCEIVCLAIVSDPNSSIFVTHRLVPSRTQIDNAETIVSDGDSRSGRRASGRINTGIVGSAMARNGKHLPQQHLFCDSCHSCNAAHSVLGEFVLSISWLGVRKCLKNPAPTSESRVRPGKNVSDHHR